MTGVRPPTGATYTAPARIPADCSTDVTPELASWVATVPDDAVLSLPATACYRIDTTLVIDKRHDLMVEGHGATLKAVAEGARTRSHLRIRASSNVTVHDLVVRGANPHAGTADNAYRVDREAQHAFDIVNADGVLLDDVQAYDVFGDFVYIGGLKPSRNVTVRNSRFERNGRQGISVTNADDVVVEANSISDVRRSLFDVEPNFRTAHAQGVQLLSNRTGPVHNFWLASKGVGSGVGNLSIRANTMVAPSGGLIWVRTPGALAPRTSFTIDANTFLAHNAVSDEGSIGAFFFENCADVTITANQVKFEPRGRIPAVELRASNRVMVERNRLDGSRETVMADSRSTDVHHD